MNLRSTVLFSGVITLLKISSNFMASKLIAMYAGPAGVGIIGQFQNFISIITNLSTASTQNGIVKYLAQSNDRDKLKIVNAAFLISFLSSLCCTLLCFFCSKSINNLLFNEKYSYGSYIKISGFLSFAFAGVTVIQSVLNGEGSIKKLSFFSAICSILGIIVTYTFVSNFRLNGAMVSILVIQVISLIIGIFFFLDRKYLNYSNFKDLLVRDYCKKLIKFGIAAGISSIIVPLSQIIIRNIYTNHFGINISGIWQGLTKVSDAYLYIITTSLSIYYLPKLSSLNTKSEIKKELREGYAYLIPIMLISSVVIYFLRYFIIRILYTADFNLMGDLFFFQLLGSVLKIFSWMLSYVMLAKAMMRKFIITEILFSATYILLSYYLIPVFGFSSISIAFFANYLLYFITMLIMFRSYII